MFIFLRIISLVMLEYLRTCLAVTAYSMLIKIPDLCVFILGPGQTQKCPVDIWKQGGIALLPITFTNGTQYLE